MASSSRAAHSNLIRMTPLHIAEIPAHPTLPRPDDVLPLERTVSSSGRRESIPSRQPQPELLPFFLSLLDDGLRFLSPTNFARTFSHHSTKSPPPSSSDVEVLTYSIPSEELAKIVWSLPNPDLEASTATTAANNTATTTGTNTRSSVASTASNRLPHGSPLPLISRSKPRNIPNEYWIARRSIHPNISSKTSSGGGSSKSWSANWNEFVYGLRDNHSQHEQDFTPTLFDARKVCDWNDVLAKAEDEGRLGGRRSGDTTNLDVGGGGGTDVGGAEAGAEGSGLGLQGYENVTMSVYEMCHEVGPLMNPRCFPILVATASLVMPESSSTSSSTTTRSGQQSDETAPTIAASSTEQQSPTAAGTSKANTTGHTHPKRKFVAVTVPVNLGAGVDAAFYSNGKNKTQGTTSSSKKDVVVGTYASVETVTLFDSAATTTSPADGLGTQQPGEVSAVGNDGNEGKIGASDAVREGEGSIEWVMATASDAKGNVPMWTQKLAVPGKVPDDVKFFLRWIRNIDDKEINAVKP